jgi:hypothetical protein
MGEARVRIGKGNVAALVLSVFAGVAGIEMALASFAVQYFSGSGFLQALSCAFVGLNLWHGMNLSMLFS